MVGMKITTQFFATVLAPSPSDKKKHSSLHSREQSFHLLIQYSVRSISLVGRFAGGSNLA